MDAFRRGEKDVLVATDVASKGLDFAGIHHVINYDMPDDIENYVHSELLQFLTAISGIGRTGRSGKRGRSTTFLNKRTGILLLIQSS